MMASRADLSVIVPLADDPQHAAEIFDALSASDLPRRSWELIVVAAGQPKAAIEVAAQRADVIVRLDGLWTRDTAYRFNRGAEVARAPVLVFLECDVIVRPDTLRRIRCAFADDQVDALVAGVDPAPRSASLSTRYVTLLQDWAHRRCAGESEHFTIRASAIRARAFLSAGYLDEWQRPPLEGAATELGLRLRALGYRVELRNEVRVANRGYTPWARAAQPSAIQQSPPRWLPTEGARQERTATYQFRMRERRLSIAAWAAAALFVAAAGLRSANVATGGMLCATLVLAADAPLAAHLARGGE